MENLYKIKKALMNGLEELDTVKGGKIKMGELEAIKMITSALDHIDNICDHEEDGESMDGYSGKRHYVRGHYSRDGYSRDSYAGKRDSMGRYSREDAKREMMSHLESAASAAPDDYTRSMARDLMDKVDRA